MHIRKYVGEGAYPLHPESSIASLTFSTETIVSLHQTSLFSTSNPLCTAFLSACCNLLLSLHFVPLHRLNKCAHSNIKLAFPLYRYVNQSEHGCPVPPNQSSSTTLISQQTRSREKRETKRQKKTREWRKNIYGTREWMTGMN